MKFEDAFFYKNLLMLGYESNYDEWLDSYLESEDPLSDIVLDLSCCSSDVGKTISLLHNYCADQPLDEFAVCNRLRLFFKELYYSNRMSKEKITLELYRLALVIRDCENFDKDDIYDCQLWGSMYYLDDFYSLAEEGIISWESFDFAFFSYLDNGTPLDSKLIWSKNPQKKPSLLDRIKSRFKH